MLKSLFIKNIGGISEAQINFYPGLNVITGESGSGKSSIIRSLELLAASRAYNKFIRAGEKKAEVIAHFYNKKYISREVLSSGRSKTRIQNEIVSSSEATELINSLMKIQSQFANLDLLNSERQLEILDSCLPEDVKSQLIPEFQKTFDLAKQSNNELRTLKKFRSETEKNYGNHKEIFQLMNAAQPEKNLQTILENSLSDISHKITLFEKAALNLNILTGGLSGEGLLENTRSAFENLYDFLNPEDKKFVTNSLDKFENILKTLHEDSLNISHAQTERDKIENRLGALRKLKRITNIYDEDELIKYCSEMREKLKWLESSNKDLEDLSEKTFELKRAANILAMNLRKARHDCSEELSERVNNILERLGMNDIKFAINFSGLQKLRSNGADEIEFILNEGLRSGRAEKIASGGELSRLLLALQMSLPERWLTPTIIFDEVEAGLGGRAAVLTGMQLKELSRKCQVILVTHEASIAALGDKHILVCRENSESFTKEISGEERTQEIARMLSGNPNVSEALEHARILLK